MCQCIWRLWVETLQELCLLTKVAFTSSLACSAHSCFQGRVWKLLRLTTMLMEKNYFKNPSPLFNNLQGRKLFIFQISSLHLLLYFAFCRRVERLVPFPKSEINHKSREKKESFSRRSVIINVLLILLDVVTHAAGGQTQNVSGFSFVKVRVWNQLPPPLFFFSFLLPVCQGTVSFDLFTRQGGVGGEEDPRPTTGAACEQIKVIKAKMSPGTHLVSALSRDPLTSERRRHAEAKRGK